MKILTLHFTPRFPLVYINAEHASEMLRDEEHIFPMRIWRDSDPIIFIKPEIFENLIVMDSVAEVRQ